MPPSNQPPRVTVEDALALAIEHHNAGRLAEAEDIYERILAALPNHHDALHLLGLVANEKGDNERAVSLIEQAISVSPNVGEMHGNLGLVFSDLGRFEDAAKHFTTALTLNPGFAEGHNNLGLVLQDIGRLDDAVSSFENAIDLNPEFVEAHSNLGNVFKIIGHLTEAEASHRRAIDVTPKFAEAHNNLGNVLHAMGRLDEAIESFQTALALNAGYADATTNLGSVLQEQGLLDDAIQCYRDALALDAALAQAHGNLGAALTEQDALEQAYHCYREAIALTPENETFWIGMSACVERLSIASADDDILDMLLQLLEHPAIDPQTVALAALDALQCHDGFAAITANPSAIDIAEAVKTLSAIPLLLRLMTLSPIKDLTFESTMTALRKALLERAPESGWPFLAALANQCFLNEYVFAESNDEGEAVAQLSQDIARRLTDKQPIELTEIAVLAAYRPLHEHPQAEALLAHEWPEALQDVITRQIAEPLKEKASRADMPILVETEDTVSQSVRAQYEENPYPRWVKFAAQHRAAPIGTVLAGAPLRFDLPGYDSPNQPELLIAGCGTGQQALLVASRFQNDRILAVDLSLSSLSYALRKTRELNVENIDYAQGDIMGLGTLDRQFDLVECVGVLHHMANPLAGWRILNGLLKPGGVMKIGLYSEAARQDVVAARKFIAEQGYISTPEGIRECRKAIAELARNGNTEMQSIVSRNSFYTVSELRDLLFHVQEHRFTLPQIKEALQMLDLEFLGFEFGNSLTARQYAGAPASLDDWHQFECDYPETFSAMYQFWVRKT